MASKRAMGLICLAVVLTVAICANAVTYSGNVEYSAGTGSDYCATVVLDFDQDSSFLFNYTWDQGQDPTGWDALLAIDAASEDFTMEYTDFGWGILVDDFDYTGGTEFDYVGAGDTTGLYYWAYYEGDNSTWSENMSGVSARYLTDGNWDSWVWTNSYGEWPNSVIRTPGQQPVAVPEPTTLVSLALGGLLIRRKRRA